MDLLVALLGGHPPTTVDIFTATPQGPVARTVPWQVFVDALGSTSFGGKEAADGPLSSNCLGLYCGPDWGSGGFLPGRFCDNSSGWVLHRSSPGTAYTIISPGAPAGTVCGGLFGPAFFWDEAELSPLDVPTTLAYEGCYATLWTVHANGYCPNAFTARSSFLTSFRASGRGVASSIAMGGLSLDYYLGVGSHLRADMCIANIGNLCVPPLP